MFAFPPQIQELRHDDFLSLDKIRSLDRLWPENPVIQQIVGKEDDAYPSADRDQKETEESGDDVEMLAERQLVNVIGLSIYSCIWLQICIL